MRKTVKDAGFGGENEGFGFGLFSFEVLIKYYHGDVE